MRRDGAQRRHERILTTGSCRVRHWGVDEESECRAGALRSSCRADAAHRKRKLRGQIMEQQNVKRIPGTEGTLAELADPGFAVDPQWIVWGDVTVPSSDGA